MTSQQIRQSFLDFFKSKGHTIVPSSSLLPDAPNLLFTNAGMNQFVPIFLGQRAPDVDKWPCASPGLPTRAADTQKCIRAGGKHNDLEDVGLDTYHHTFFEMLGNWSFGDYFKKEAIEWAWELIVEKWKFPKDRLYATVYKPGPGEPAEFDQEAYDHWTRVFTAAGLDPKVHIVDGGKKDNFWMMGDTGPCGPCSEIHMDLTPEGNTGGSLVNTGDARCIEIWNLVFIQFNANADGTFSPLPAKHVDTGMGFERVTSFIQCTKGFTDFANAKISNYETDIFRPIFDAIEKLSGKKYCSTLPTDTGSTGNLPVPLGDPPSGMGMASHLSSSFNSQTSALPAFAGEVAQRHGPLARSTQGVATGATYSKRNLPHFEKPWAIYHVIINTIAARELSPVARDIVFDSILHWRDSRYRLVAACVMPDHAHFIIQPGVKEEDKDGNPVFWSLSEILHSIKSYSAKEVNKLDNVKGTLWQQERYDRYMRSDGDLQEKFHYVCRNPWASGLVEESEPWPWLWTPDIEAWKPYVPLNERKGSTSILPVPLGDPPSGMGEAFNLQISAGAATSVPSHSAGPVAQRDAQEQVAIDVAFRVIADHIRTLSFAIADGIQPGNTDRNYVLRRILRRAVRYGRTLGFHEPFFYKLVDVLSQTMGDVFPEIREKRRHVEKIIRVEEETFNRTLDKGIEYFNVHCAGLVARSLLPKDAIAHDAANAQLTLMGGADADNWESVVEYARKKDPLWNVSQISQVSGEAAFYLSDTLGFPLDLTQLMARERGLTVDTARYSQLLDEQRTRARAAQKKQLIELAQLETTAPTKFIGYDTLETEAKVLELVDVKDKTAVVLDISTAYAEMGGQIGDTGELSHGAQLWRIVNTQKSGNTWLHFIVEAVEQATSLSRPATGRTEPGGALKTSGPFSESDATPIPPGGSPGGTGGSPVLPIVGSEVILLVDGPRRNAIQRHHTVTHLLHWALHEVVSKDATQKGSYVGPEKLTFDFSSAPLTPAQVRDVEKLVNERILENAGVSWIEVPFAEVKNRKDIMQFFGDKYGDTVRVVQIGGQAKALDGYSMELCGGTHTRATGEIGLFRIVNEGAIAAGIRRIEAVAGLQAYERAKAEAELISQVAARVNSPLSELEKKIESLLAQQKELEKQLKAGQQKQAVETARGLLGKTKEFDGIAAVIENMGSADGDYLQSVADALKGQFKGVIVLGGVANNAVSLVAAVSPELTSKVQAGKIIQTIAPIVGGKGGGRPDNARGGGKDVSKLGEALARAASMLGP